MNFCCGTACNHPSHKLAACGDLPKVAVGQKEAWRMFVILTASVTWHPCSRQHEQCGHEASRRAGRLAVKPKQPTQSRLCKHSDVHSCRVQLLAAAAAQSLPVACSAAEAACALGLGAGVAVVQCTTEGRWRCSVWHVSVLHAKTCACKSSDAAGGCRWALSCRAHGSGRGSAVHHMQAGRRLQGRAGRTYMATWPHPTAAASTITGTGAPGR